MSANAISVTGICLERCGSIPQSLRFRPDTISGVGNLIACFVADIAARPSQGIGQIAAGRQLLKETSPEGLAPDF
ncbi:MAG: hypothetical protein CMK06_07295 [Ponticaulis sp.]|nr:hypothetical protein [Ponticaulis sp.]